MSQLYEKETEIEKYQRAELEAHNSFSENEKEQEILNLKNELKELNIRYNELSSSKKETKDDQNPVINFEIKIENVTNNITF